MRALCLLVVLMVSFVATAFAENVEHRSLRIADDDTEERGVSSLLKGLKVKSAKKYQATKTYFKNVWKEADMYVSFKNGESQDSIFARMGVKPSHVDSNGNKFYDADDPLVKAFDRQFLRIQRENTHP